MEELKALFTYIKKIPFLKDLTGIDPNSGVQNRINGVRYTSSNPAELRPEEREGIKNGLVKLRDMIDAVIKLL